MLSETDKSGFDIDETLRRIIDKCLLNGKTIHVIKHSEDRPLEKITNSHCHSHWEIFTVLGGSLAFESMSEGLKIFDEGSFIMVPPACLHTSVRELEQPLDLEYCVLDPSDDSESHGILSWMHKEDEYGTWKALPPSIVARWGVIAEATPMELFAKASKSLKNGEWGAEHACSLLRMAITSLGEALTSIDPKSQRNEPDPRIIKVLALLHKEYYNQALSIDILARACAISKVHLFNLFKSTTGTSIHQTLIDIRLRRAKDFLENGRYSIKEIAGMTGWKNQLYFSSSFKKRYGVPPSAFREHLPH